MCQARHGFRSLTTPAPSESLPPALAFPKSPEHDVEARVTLASYVAINVMSSHLMNKQDTLRFLMFYVP